MGHFKKLKERWSEVTGHRLWVKGWIDQSEPRKLVVSDVGHTESSHTDPSAANICQALKDMLLTSAMR